MPNAATDPAEISPDATPAVVVPPAATDEGEAARLAHEREDPAANARRWLLQEHVATLCTTSARAELEGYPFGSVVPFSLTPTGQPVVYIATIAAHTANLRRDNRASLFVRQPDTEGDPQNGWRLTVMGRMRRLALVDEEVSVKDADLVDRVSADELADVHARYLEHTPWASDYGLTHGFAYWRMTEVEKVRYIAGFGKICWIAGADALREPLGGGLAEAGPGAVQHMNEDHAENLLEMCRGHYGLAPKSAVMSGIDRAGMTVETTDPDRRLFFSFNDEIDEATLRPAVIDVLVRARKKLGQR